MASRARKASVDDASLRRLLDNIPVGIGIAEPVEPDGSIILSGLVNHSGGLTNSGTGSAINTISGTIGTNVTGVVQNSATSKLVLAGTNTYTGSTVVAEGGLIVSGSIASSTTTVQSGGWLGGSGTVGSLTIESGGTVAPGNSPGTINISGNIDWLGGGNYNWQVLDTVGTAGTTWDLISATGQLDLSALTVSSQFNINLWSLASTGPDVSGAIANFNNTTSYAWTILTAAGGMTGYTGTDQFLINTTAINGTDGFANALAPGWGFSIVQSGNNLNLVYAQQVSQAVPEPGTWAAAALLVGGAAFMRWRKRAKIS